MQSLFYISKDGANIGPFPLETVLKKIEGLEIQWTDYLYDDVRQEWIMILEYPLLTEKFNSGFGRPQANPMVPPDYGLQGPDNKLKEKAWFILRDGNNYGPYSYLELLQMLQEKTLYEHDFVWQQGLDAWKRIAELNEFSAEAVKNLKDHGDNGIKEIFFRRRHIRAKYGCTLILHDNKSIYKGRSVEIGAGGAGIVVPTQALHPGQNVFLHFQPGDGVPPFNAICNVVSKKFVRTEEKQPDSGQVRYGVRFTSLSTNVRETIKSFAESKAGSGSSNAA
jgi:hypothetical protein